MDCFCAARRKYQNTFNVCTTITKLPFLCFLFFFSISAIFSLCIGNTNITQEREESKVVSFFSLTCVAGQGDRQAIRKGTGTYHEGHSTYMKHSFKPARRSYEEGVWWKCDFALWIFLFFFFCSRLMPAQQGIREMRSDLGRRADWKYEEKYGKADQGRLFPHPKDAPGFCPRHWRNDWARWND